MTTIHGGSDADALGFSTEWDQRYAEGTHLSSWPWTDVVAYTHRYALPREAFRTVLELGCGAGANIPFFAARGDHYYAIEGSANIVGRLHHRFPDLAGNIVVGDFTKVIPFSATFDLVVDRGSMTSNDTRSIERCLELVFARLRSGGLMIGIDWCTSAHSDALKGAWVDSHTRRDIDSAMLHSLGRIHFSDRTHLLGLLGAAGFEVTVLENKTGRMLIGGDGLVRDMFNFVAVKP